MSVNYFSGNYEPVVHRMTVDEWRILSAELEMVSTIETPAIRKLAREFIALRGIIDE
jgi:hypothetical protein